MNSIREFFTSLPDGFVELREALIFPIADLLTLGLVAAVIVFGFLGFVFSRRRAGASRIAAMLCGALAAAAVVVFGVRWLMVAGGSALLTEVGVALVAVLGGLTYWLVRKPGLVARAVGGLFGLGALSIAGLLAVWWTVSVAVMAEAIVAWWEFGDEFVGVLLMGGSIVLIALFCMLAYRLRERLGWTSALFGAMAVLLALWWLIGIIPSAWVYFADTQKEVLADRIIPSAIVIGNLEVASNFYNVFRDTIVVIEGGIVLGIGAAVMLVIQRRFPKGLAEGEERGPTTGGYK
jgi:hypothetical protein